MTGSDQLVMLASEGLVTVLDIEKWLAEVEAKMSRAVCPTATTVDEWAEAIRLSRRCLLALPDKRFTEAA